jgi:hypothetical protein
MWRAASEAAGEAADEAAGLHQCLLLGTVDKIRVSVGRRILNCNVVSVANSAARATQ